MRSIPKWLFELPPGIYETSEISSYAGTGSQHIRDIMEKYGATVRQVPSGYRNLFKNVFEWQGLLPSVLEKFPGRTHSTSG